MSGFGFGGFGSSNNSQQQQGTGFGGFGSNSNPSGGRSYQVVLSCVFTKYPTSAPPCRSKCGRIFWREQSLTPHLLVLLSRLWSNTEHWLWQQYFYRRWAFQRQFQWIRIWRYVDSALWDEAIIAHIARLYTSVAAFLPMSTSGASTKKQYRLFKWSATCRVIKAKIRSTAVLPCLFARETIPCSVLDQCRFH